MVGMGKMVVVVNGVKMVVVKIGKDRGGGEEDGGGDGDGGGLTSGEEDGGGDRGIQVWCSHLAFSVHRDSSVL